ncbi:MAG: GNAT family N-acetyltransferase [Rhodospirillales bacterium]|nr:GNAT family N-acetyltransferase [Alphaproteobacteria bacterium]MCB1839934.1 GNAT family N-acetyltransferase [Alphaproteobacteria bacterium]MCB9976557.1 GNAT family N-acetyltransferase [Rhodospirillales bacterium]
MTAADPSTSLPLDVNARFASVRLAKSPAEIEEAQRLRFQVFYEEFKAQPTPDMLAQKRDFDPFDEIADHLIVLTRNSESEPEKIVGTYRLIRQEVAEKFGRFYSQDEYDISPLVRSGQYLLELGRSCVLAPYRTKPILNLLWQGIADYITGHNIDLLFGCASFPGTDVDALAPQLSYLHHYHPTQENIRPVALKNRYVEMNRLPREAFNEKRVFASLPPLIKGYLRLGATIGAGAVIDEQFNTTDVCIVVQTSLMTERYRKYFERKIQKTMPGMAGPDLEDE